MNRIVFLPRRHSCYELLTVYIEASNLLHAQCLLRQSRYLFVRLMRTSGDVGKTILPTSRGRSRQDLTKLDDTIQQPQKIRLAASSIVQASDWEDTRKEMDSQRSSGET